MSVAGPPSPNSLMLRCLTAPVSVGKIHGLIVSIGQPYKLQDHFVALPNKVFSDGAGGAA